MRTTSTYDFRTLVEGLEVNHPVRVVTREGEPWFNVADTCRILDRSNPTMAVRGLDPDETALILCEAKGSRNHQPVPTNFVSESGLYKLILRANKTPAAKPFQDWVNREVLPSIRKTGSFSLGAGETMPLPTSFAHALRVWDGTSFYNR